MKLTTIQLFKIRRGLNHLIKFYEEERQDEELIKETKELFELFMKDELLIGWQKRYLRDGYGGILSLKTLEEYIEEKTKKEK